MTVIAFDGRFVAADKMASNAGQRGTCTKIFRFKRQVLAFNGNADHGMMLRAWFEAGAVIKDYPRETDKDRNAHLTVFEKGKHVFNYEGQPVPLVTEDRLFTTGHGRDYAMMAMHLGKSAKEAVELASIYDIYCGQGVDVFDLWEVADVHDRGDSRCTAAAPSRADAA